jgi:hypothetical protein
VKVDRHALALLAAAALPACASTGAAPPPSRSTRFVLVPLSATLRHGATDDSPGVQLRAGGTSLEVMAFRRVRRRGEWVLVEPPSRPERQCHPSLALPEGLRLRFWVRASELAPALVRTVTRSGRDGSSLRAQAGLRVVRDGDTARVAISPGAQISLALDPSEVGDEFREPRPAPPREPGERLTGDVNTGFLEGGQVMTTRGAAPLWVTERRAVGGGHLAQVQVACANLAVVVPPRQVVPVMTVEMESRPEPSRPSVDETVIPVGARLRWPDGGLAGTAYADVRVGAESRRVGAMACYSILLNVEGVDGLRPTRTEFCVEPPTEDAPAP